MSSSKRTRISLACIRCRKRKVKCDFQHPQCDRCAASNLSCVYVHAPPRVDSHAFDQLGQHVMELNERMKIMQSEFIRITSSSVSQIYHSPSTTTWKLSLTPSGIRIHTNITNANDLYRILLNGISKLEINNKLYFDVPGFHGNGNNCPDPLPWKPKQECAIMAQQSAQEIQSLVHSCYQPCFLPYQIVDQYAFLQKYHNPQRPQELLLINSIHAWLSKHASLYHPDLLSHVDTAAGEKYFLEAKQQLRRCFSKSHPTTIHALLNLYMYQLSCGRTTLAYLYIGLAVRMAQDLGFHKKEHMSIDLKQREINKRLWWSVYWLDLCAALESNRPTTVDDKDCNMEYPSQLQDEDQETGYRIAFSVESIKLMKIRKAIAKHLPSERKSGTCLLDAVSDLELSLTKWLQELPFYFTFSRSNIEKATSFCDEACLILNIQYHTTWVMLHKLFLLEQETAASPVALLSLDVCIKSANLISHLLQMYAKQTHWCHFYYCLDGVVESVYIHQKSVVCNPTDVTAAKTAFHHLSATIQILYKSPLKYMQKVQNVIEQSKEFLGQRDQEIPQEPVQKQETSITTMERIILRNPNISIMGFKPPPTFSNEELNQILSIYND